MASAKPPPRTAPPPPKGAAQGPPPPPGADKGRTPFAGLCFLNTREATTAGALTRWLTALGGRVVEQPLLAFDPPESWQLFDAAAKRLRPGDWVAFTSATAARRTLERLTATGAGVELLRRAKLAAVGEATADALEERGLEVALVPATFQAEGLADELAGKAARGSRVWLPQAAAARDVMAEELRREGMEVMATPAYRTVMPVAGLGPALNMLLQGKVDWLLFTSPSTVNHFFQALSAAGTDKSRLRWPRVACLGAVTAGTARARGLRVAVLPLRQDVEGLVAALVTHVTQARS